MQTMKRLQSSPTHHFFSANIKLAAVTEIALSNLLNCVTIFAHLDVEVDGLLERRVNEALGKKVARAAFPVDESEVTEFVAPGLKRSCLKTCNGPGVSIG